MKKLVSFFLLCSFFQLGFTQVATFDWKIHTSYTKPSSIATNGELVLTAFKNGILAYDIEENEVEAWSYTNYLSDVELSQIFYDKASKSFWIGYVNGNIDVLKDNTIINIPYLKLASIIGSKKINSFTSKDGLIYAVADFGILLIDPVKYEIKETYYTNQEGNNNLQIAFFNNAIYTLTQKTIYRANSSNPILSDYNQWTPVPELTIDSLSNYITMINWKDQLVIGVKTNDYGNDTLLFYKNGVITQPIQKNYEISNLHVIDQQLCIVEDYGVQFIDENYHEAERFYQYESGKSPNLSSLVKVGEDFYLADKQIGLVKFRNNWSNTRLSLEGPSDSRFYRAKSRKGKLIFAAGRIEKTGALYQRAEAYLLEDNEWSSFGRSNRPELQSINVWDFNAADIHPKNLNQYAVAGVGEDNGLFIVENGEITAKYGLNNSILEYVLDNTDLMSITDIKYDKKGNLWILNAFSNYPLKVLTSEGVIYQFNTGSATRRVYVDRLQFDDKGNPWFIVRDKGICGYFTNGTIEDASDDSYKLLNTGDFSGALPSNDVTDIISTKDGRFWITTSEGFSILNNPPSVQDATAGNYNTYRPKVQFGENTEYFFGETYITCGITDGGNRKWIGTMDAGLFCLSEDGYSILQEYNISNSRLISNSILDLAFNDKTGELFVVTDLGLESIRVDASEGTTDYKDVIVFPNPVLPEYSGYITIQGIKENSDVKITDVAGNLVYSTSSNGGTAVWDGKKVNGDEVASGVYLIWTANKKGKGRKVGNVTVIR